MPMILEQTRRHLEDLKPIEFSEGTMGVPKHLSSDNDPLFTYRQWQANLRMLDVDEVKTVPHIRWSHPFVERLIGSLRRELLD